MVDAALIVIAKQPVAGRAKTRLTPPCTPQQAADLADAALRDTLDAVAAAPVTRRVLVFDGDPEPWLLPGFQAVAQSAGPFGDRLQTAFDAVRPPALLIGMDTPQVTSALLGESVAALQRPDVDCVLGPTPDGGYWCIGFNDHAAGAFTGVPMSTDETYVRQCQRLAELGARLADPPLPGLRDVDTIEDARAVAAAAPQTRFARALDAMR